MTKNITDLSTIATAKWNNLAAIVQDAKSYEHSYDRNAVAAMFMFIAATVDKPYHKIVMLRALLCENGAANMFIPFQFLKPDVLDKIELTYLELDKKASQLTLKEQYQFFEQ